ncbi:mediator of RNA polymerase II transcription subunit 15-like isoform X1 [Melia azedarach]|uniref:Mediator of RNA polymerase II transcription subunit 15-like isoform X1 n=1 Tax=Melia azedarach TaxID=155640 RepID=A0ACC1WVM5_MELAZ|nr:mediator of RNA polymerase II transcription subunit 15-like isoform X1 [Melia azedarach]
MGGQEERKQASPDPPPPPPPSSQPDSSTPSPPPPFDPSRMIGIIKRKALIKELAALYHAECLAYCQELLELQKKWEEPFVDAKAHDDTRKEMTRLPKRAKKTR